ncbi:tripartite tricarboxylate transporter substrate binding protein [Pusillimonas sp. SM2304]|uniref:Bug family tripartite tricarboxylate transporter substrate binding protein n=1 Tax=Pusillimonas sp. SM2304 TaxID=3073241 RepID=UPI0028746C03|nr:tripartite tricarboxylate transporter substrate binding protein [Pusillimonas sp. SM2304]MDS1140402.1 tripartite tricarboxylate transporter substrate binding protein [Pusillimonas sp. SM2304]
MKIWKSAGLALLVSVAPLGAQAQQASWPAKPITIVVPFPPGGATDVMARILAPKIEKAVGQPVVIENKAGAGGTIGTRAVANAKNDGYTFLWGTVATHGIGPNIRKNSSYDAVKDFTPVVHVVDQPYVLVVHPSLGVSSVAELTSKAKANPGGISAASAGQGTGAHMILEKYQTEAQSTFLQVPYKGAGPAMTDLLGGQVKLTFDVILTTVPYIEAKRVIPLAVTSASRSLALPDVPTMNEAGITGFNAVGWNGIFAPAGTSDDIVQKVNVAVNEALKLPEIKDRIIKDGSIPVGGSPEQFQQFVESELASWGDVARKANVMLD